MANTKVADLGALATVATDDELYIVDVSDSTDHATGTSKKITRANLVAGLSADGHTHTESDITDLGTYLENITGESLADLSDVVQTTPADNEVLAYDNGSGNWINQTPAEAGLAEASHNHATSDITSGTLAHERGGLEADVSAYSGLVAISGGATAEVDSKAELEAQIGSPDLALASGDVYSGTHDFGGATSLEVPNGTNPTVSSAGHLALDTDGDGSTVTTAVLKAHNGTGSVNIFGTTNYPSSDNDVMAFDSATNSVTWQAQSGAGGGISNVVEDTTPQLGGALDANGNDIQFDDATGIDDDSGNELIIFQKATSAVNQIDIGNAATGSHPTITATGGDTNINLDLAGKGTGVVRAGGAEVATISDSQTLTNKTINASNNTISNLAPSMAANTTGADTAFATGTAGTNGNLSQWNVDGDLVDSSIAAADVVTGSSTDTLTNKTFDANGTGNSLSNVEVADFAGTAIVTEGEGINSSDNDTSLPTSAAVKNYVDTFSGSSNITTVGTVSSGNVDAAVSAASTSAAGKVEIAIASEVNTGTDATRAVSPDALAGSNFGIRYFQPTVVEYTTDIATGDGQWYLDVPAGLNGMNLVEVRAKVITAGTTGTTDIQIHNVTDAVDMLSTKMTIDSGETSTSTAATAAVINTANDDIATGDTLRIDIDAVSTTAPKGLIVTLGFQLP